MYRMSVWKEALYLSPLQVSKQLRTDDHYAERWRFIENNQRGFQKICIICSRSPYSLNKLRQQKEIFFYLFLLMTVLKYAKSESEFMNQPYSEKPKAYRI